MERGKPHKRATQILVGALCSRNNNVEQRRIVRRQMVIALVSVKPGGIGVQNMAYRILNGLNLLSLKVFHNGDNSLNLPIISTKASIV